MRRPRTRACEQCRLAKTRCNLSAPCTRCDKRRLDCHYDTPLQDRGHQVDQRTLRPLRPANVQVDIPEQAHGVSKTPGVDECPIKLKRPETAPVSEDATHDAISEYNFMSNTTTRTPLDNNLPSASMKEPFDLPDSFEISDFDFDFDIPFPTSEAMFRPPEAQLEQRSRSFHQGALTAKMMFGKLGSYSRMMADAKRLPPFIWPPCWSSRPSRCPSDSPHRCLPETLAVCSNLIQMHSLRRDGSESFVWQQIYAHLKQLRDKVALPFRRLLETI